MLQDLSNHTWNTSFGCELSKIWPYEDGFVKLVVWKLWFFPNFGRDFGAYKMHIIEYFYHIHNLCCKIFSTICGTYHLDVNRVWYDIVKMTLWNLLFWKCDFPNFGSNFEAHKMLIIEYYYHIHNLYCKIFSTICVLYHLYVNRVKYSLMKVSSFSFKSANRGIFGMKKGT